MISKLQTLILFPILFTAINCSCPIGYFTKDNPCDTKATLIKSSKFTSIDIGVREWHYFYLPLSGLGDTFGLSFQVDGLPVDAYIIFQQENEYKLPTESYYNYGFHANDGSQTIPLATLTSGMKNKNTGKMLLGIYNSHFLDENVKIRFYIIDEDKDDKSTLNRFIIALVSTVLVGIFALLCTAIIIHRNIKRRREILRRQNARLEYEAQGILISPAQGDQNHAKSADAFTLEEFQTYFPKKSFGELKNQFQQTGCSVCLEDFSAETSCYQFYCNHIFHEACIQIWLEKRNSCPTCRVPLGKKAIEEFFEAQKKQTEVNSPENIEIKIQDQEVTSERE